jgi:MFS transporter, FHS family, glucose/mannose:H+ symporter
MHPVRSSSRPSDLDLHVGFFLAGMVTTLLGPIVPALARRWTLPDAAIGALFSTQFLCSTALSIASSSLVMRFDATRVMAVGFALMAGGVALVGIAQWPFAVGAVALYGFGLGLVLPTTNFLVVAAHPTRESAAVSLVNFSWSIGAVTWPVLVASFGRPTDVMVPTALLGSLLAVLAVRLLLLLYSQRAAALSSGLSAHVRASPQPPGIQRVGAGTVAVFGALMFLYAGTEAALGGWMAEHVRRLAPSRSGWTLAPTLFWAALATGRLLTPGMLRAATEPVVVGTGLGVAACATVVLIAGTSVPLAFLVATVSGFGLAPVFPITLARMTRLVGATRPRLVGPLFSVTGMGGAALPWAVGFVSTLSHSLRIGLIVPLLGCVLMGGLMLLGRNHSAGR